jgi:hypothetical protein
MNPDAYIKEIRSIDNEIKRLATHTKGLREQRAKNMNSLYIYMSNNKIDKIGEGKGAITIKQCGPRDNKKKMKPKKQRREDSIEKLRERGIPDPESFYEEYERSKYREPREKDSNFTNHSHSSTFTHNNSKNSKNKEVDMFLGF